MNKYPYKEAKALIRSIFKAARDGEYDTREKFHAMLEANPDVAAKGYNAFGKVFFWNPASAHLFGCSESAAVNRDLFDMVIPPEMRPLLRDLIRCAAKTGKLPEPASCDLFNSSGEYVTVFSGHLMFQWDSAAVPEFYCIDVGIAPQMP